MKRAGSQGRDVTSDAPADQAKPAPREPSSTDTASATQLPTVDLLGARFHRVSEAEANQHILDELEHGRGGWVVTPNLDILRQMTASPPLWRFLQKAELCVADGMPLVWASRIIKDPLPERVAGSSLINTLSHRAAEAGRSVFFLGGAPGAAEEAARRLTEANPTLRVAGTACPPFGFERDPVYLERLRQQVQQAQPDIVYVGLGCPKQERLIYWLRPHHPGAWYLGIGISFSYVAGDVKRAPPWMRKTGLEWIFRLIQEPKRLGRRYLREGLPFGLRLAATAVQARLGKVVPFLGRGASLAPRR